MCPSHFCLVRVESESQALRVRVIQHFFESSQGQSHDLFESSHKNCRVTSSHWLEAGVNVESHEISRFYYVESHEMSHFLYFLLWNGTQHAIQWHPISYKMVSNVVLTSLISGYLYLSFLSLHFTCLFHYQSFQKSNPSLLQVLQSLS